MNSKIGDKMLTMISAVAVIDILVDLLNNSSSLGDIPLAGSLNRTYAGFVCFLAAEWDLYVAQVVICRGSHCGNYSI